MRRSCLDCTRKHLAQASILMCEARLGYPTHKWMALGHLAEAEAECLTEYPHLAIMIREQRKAYEVDLMHIVLCDELIEEVCHAVRSSPLLSGDPGEALLLPETLDADPGETPGGASHSLGWGSKELVPGTSRRAQSSDQRY